MKLNKIEIKNYRNLDGLAVKLEEQCNFIVGENNLGKSNFLNLLNTIFTARAFKESDFYDCSREIEVKLQIVLEDIEIGHFDDLFSDLNHHLINITCLQPTTDDNIEYYHSETNTNINASLIRQINFMYYDSLRNPINEISFDKARGVGKFLANFVKKHLEEQEITENDFLNTDKIEHLLGDINSKISKLKAFSDFNILAKTDSNLENMLVKIIMLKDENGQPLAKSGYGIQFLILITLSILDRIQSIIAQRKEKGIFKNDADNTKYISLILGFDEPEIHLHPYMQRSLIRYLNQLISNKNEGFSALIKDLFNIDGFIGQIITITHSPNILLDNHRQITRFFEESSITKIKSGLDVSLDPQQLKHLWMHFPFFKEAFFSRCVIFVEGVTEEGSFPYFATSMGICFDDLGISIIPAYGGNFSTIKLLVKLANQFNINAVGIGDRDKLQSASEPLFITNKMDFEEELISLVDLGFENVLSEIVMEFNGEKAYVQKDSLNKYALGRYKIVNIPYSERLVLSEIDKTNLADLKAFYLTWFSDKKSYSLGRLIGKKLSVDTIPQIYKTVILKAKDLSENGEQ